jgi:hypothetical protein
MLMFSVESTIMACLTYGDVHNLDTPLKFKRALLSKRNEINIVPKHFMYGPQKLNVILTQLRCSTSFLNND